MKTSTTPKCSLRKNYLLTAALLTIFSVMPSFADDITLLNPSFESPAITANTEEHVTPDDWTIATGASAYIDNGTAVAANLGSPQSAPDGQQVADIGNTELFQNTGVVLVAGTTYTLSFYATTGTATEFYGSLSAAGDTTSVGTDFGTQSYIVSQDTPFSLYSVSATYTGPSGQYLSAVIGTAGGGYAGFDEVTLSTVPEPGTTGLMAAALIAGMTLVLNKRRVRRG